MEHPLIGQLDHLSEDELLTKITELNSKLTMVSRSGNGYLAMQLRMALESYQTVYQNKIRKNLESHKFADKINISNER